MKNYLKIYKNKEPLLLILFISNNNFLAYLFFKENIFEIIDKLRDNFFKRFNEKT